MPPAGSGRRVWAYIYASRAQRVNSNHKHCNVNDLDTNHERSTSTRMETIAHGEGLKHFMKTGRVLQAISCPACRAHHGVH